MPMSKEKFRCMLENHDWYYEYSDNYKLFCSGRDQLSKIERIASSDPGLREIYDDFVKKLNED